MIPLLRAGGVPCLAVAVAFVGITAGCLRQPVPNPNVIVISMPNGPSTLDPRMATDDFSQKAAQLLYGNLFEWDDHLRLMPGLAETLEHPAPLVYVAHLRRGIRFHDGHELTSADVVYTFRSMLDPATASPRRGAYAQLASVEARGRYTIVFTLTEPFSSFPTNLVAPIVPDGATPSLRDHPVGTGPYRFLRYLPDDRLELAAFDGYFGGRPSNAGVILKVVPDDVMRALELRKGSVDLVLNDLAPDAVFELRKEDALQVLEAPGVDYQYIGINLRDPILRDVRVRRAMAHAINRQALVEHLRRHLATVADGMLPALSWASAADLPSFAYDPVQAKHLLDEAGFIDPDADGPRVRFRVTLRVSTTEAYRLQAAVIQHDLQQVGIGVDVRSYEFATLYADVLAGNFQLYTLQWTAGSLADPDLLRRVFHSSQVPPAGFNRGRFSDPAVDALLDRAVVETDEARRRELYAEAQRRIADAIPYISLWTKTNFAVARRSLRGIQLSPLGDFRFLKDVARELCCI